MVRVCHVTSAHDSNDVRIFHKECASLAKAGYDTFLVAAGDSREEKGVHVVGLGPAPVSRRERMTKFAATVYERALELDADILAGHVFSSLISYSRTRGGSLSSGAGRFAGCVPSRGKPGAIPCDDRAV